MDEFGFSEEEYENYAAMYKNVMEELKKPEDNPDDDKEPVWDDYDLVAYSKLRIDFEYIVELLRGVVESLDQSQNDFDEVEFETRIRAIREMIAEFADDNPKLGILLTQVVDEIEKKKKDFWDRIFPLLSIRCVMLLLIQKSGNMLKMVFGF